MRPYVVRTGDHLSRIAFEQGLDADTIWNDPKNAELKKLRGNPNILLTGDILYLPDPLPKKWLPVTVGSTNKFVATPPTTTLSVTITLAGKPLANEKCLVHGLSPSQPMATDGDGKLSLRLGLSVRSVTVEFPRIPLVRTLRIGHLDPVTEPTGIRQRLAHLGYMAPRTNAGELDSAAIGSALRSFQTENQLPATGTADDATRSALERAHGC